MSFLSHSRSRKPEPGKLPPHASKSKLISSLETGTTVDIDNEAKHPATISAPVNPQPPPQIKPTHAPSSILPEPAVLPNRTTTNTPSIPIRHVSTTKNTTPSGSKQTKRPSLDRQKTMAQTRYVNMLLQLDEVPKLHNILASLFTWILLAGYIVFPATFNKLQRDESLDQRADNNLQKQALDTVRNVPLLYIAAFACGIGVLGCVWLWWRWRKNYVWVINRIFLPALMNSVAGLISTIVNVYSAQDGQYSVTAKATVTVTSACSVVTAALFLLYNSIMLTIVKRKHSKETKAAEQSQNQRNATAGYGEGEGESINMLAAVGRDVGRVV